jgi:hypothetical protein
VPAQQTARHDDRLLGDGRDIAEPARFGCPSFSRHGPLGPPETAWRRSHNRADAEIYSARSRWLIHAPIDRSGTGRSIHGGYHQFSVTTVVGKIGSASSRFLDNKRD